MSNVNARLIGLGLIAVGGGLATLSPASDLGVIILVSSVILFMLQCCLPAFMRLLYTESAADTSLCMECDYDLSGNTSGVCPECGTPVPSGAKNSGREADEHLSGTRHGASKIHG